MMHSYRRKAGVWAGSMMAVASLWLTGCSDTKVQVYTVPKENHVPQVAVKPGQHQHDQGPGHIHWQLPPGWKEERPDRLRVASFSVRGEEGEMAQVAVIPLPGVSGIELDSVNMWREELGLAPLEESDLAKEAEEVRVGDGKGHLYEMAGASARAGSSQKIRTFGVILPRQGTLWFVKMTGTDDLVAQQKGHFVSFLKSLEFHSSEEDHHAPKKRAVSANTGELPPGAGLPNWQPPEHWQPKAPGPMVLASYGIAGESGLAELTISKIGGDAGGLLANVVRWRRQINLPPITEGELSNDVTNITIDKRPAHLVDLSGTKASGEPTRMLVVVYPLGGETWFYKMMGPEGVMSKERNNLLKFVEEAH